ncbi:MAG: ribonuclease HII [Rickettsiaceae bacterium H1]|nr:ribonuclease HII [Rickettsiaceae bacterium H1]
MLNKKPDFSCENKLRGIIVGVDEVGRGPLSGPVLAAAVVVDKNNFIHGIKDSKKLSPNKRLELYDSITKGYKYELGSASVDEIDRYNILNATKLAMSRAINTLNSKIKLDNILIDGNHYPNNINIPMITVKNGDNVSISIATASIIAKVVRDQLMSDLHNDYPLYNWQKNKGYGTKEHIIAIKKYGITKHHRKSFAPIKNFLAKELEGCNDFAHEDR